MIPDGDGDGSATAPRLAAGVEDTADGLAGAPEVSEAELRQLLGVLRETFGQDLTQYKPAMLQRRAGRRMALHQLDSVADYLALVRHDAPALRALYHDLLIGVTRFFRDQEPFELLARRVLPALAAHKTGGAPIRIWVPACSTGEEAYSVAICAAELLDAGGHDTRVQIFATDVDEDAIGRARRGLYPLELERDVSAERLQRFFVRRGEQYQISRRIRDLVVFSTHDVTRDAPFSHLDLLTCRNLLIYLRAATQQRVLRLFHFALEPEGFLLLGGAESVGDAAALFSAVDGKHKLYTRKQLSRPGLLELDSARAPGPLLAVTRPLLANARPPGTLAALADKRVLDLYGPVGVVVDEALDVVQFRGRTHPYLAPAPDGARPQLLQLARPELQDDLRRATAEALDSGHPVVVSSRVDHDEARGDFRLEVLPIVEPLTRVRCLLVLFHPPHALSCSPADASPEALVHELQLELRATKSHLHGAIDEVGRVNETLESTNEQLQSANEELRSANEELQSSKEELQSTNEELTVLNDELQRRVIALGDGR
jgi:two-component system, chemotaxis family, CheB/CheR fusion protein